MDFSLKTYRRLKIKYYLKTINFFFFFHGASLNNESWIKTEQTLVKNKLKYYRVFNTLMIRTLKCSIFKNLITLLHGPIVLINTDNVELTLKKLKNINPLINLLCLKLNNKIYSRKQIKNIKKLSYIENVSIFHKSMKTLIKMPYYRFKSKKLLLISK
jgi:hypothetical protein